MRLHAREGFNSIGRMLIHYVVRLKPAVSRLKTSFRPRNAPARVPRMAHPRSLRIASGLLNTVAEKLGPAK